MARPSANRLFLLLAVAVICSVALPARAQTITTITISAPTIRQRPDQRPISQLPFWINYDDCVANNELEFDFILTGIGVTTTSLEAWAGTGDCSDPTTRLGSAATCWQVYKTTPLPDSNRGWRVAIKARDIAAQNKPGDTPNGPGSGTIEDCTNPPSARIAVTLTFVFVNGSQNASNAVTVANKTGVDVTGPVSPSNVQVESGETRLHVSWDGTTDTVSGYQLFCDPAPGEETDAGLAVASIHQLLEGGVDGALGAGGAATGGAGGTATGGAGGTTTTGDSGTGGSTSSADAGPVGPNCAGGPLVEGIIPSGDQWQKYRCGSVTGKTALDGVAHGLQNGQTYAVGVAAIDDVGNLGKLSATVCKDPEPVTDFYEYYRAAGGKGGGGFCSLSHEPGPRSIPGILALAAAAGMVRRRRRIR